MMARPSLNFTSAQYNSFSTVSSWPFVPSTLQPSLFVYPILTALYFISWSYLD